jgi:putative membrane protein
MWMHGFAGSWSTFVVILMWLFWSLLVFGVGWAMAYQLRRDRHESKSHPGETPLGILQRRYASGEITKEQFEQIRRDLES